MIEFSNRNSPGRRTSAIRLAATHPGLVLAALRSPADLAKWGTGSGGREATVAGYYRKHAQLCAVRSRRRHGRLYSAAVPDLDYLERMIAAELRHPCGKLSVYYQLCRMLAPATVVETGVFFGLSSAKWLQGLHDNGRGSMYSIDLPGGNWPGGRRYPAGAGPGFAVPAHLRNRWKLRLGPSQELLSPLLEQLGEIDIFFRDSEHTYEAMTFEFNCAWPHLRDGGLLISDDVDRNTAFQDFCGGRDIDHRTVAGIGIALRR